MDALTMEHDEAVVDLLEDAADDIERCGWTQREYVRVDGTRCLVGALQQVVNALGTSSVIYLVAVSLLAQRIGDSGWAVVNDAIDLESIVTTWNDAPGRTQQQVLDLLRGEAKEIRLEAGL